VRLEDPVCAVKQLATLEVEVPLVVAVVVGLTILKPPEDT
jgi:hypothetical protein